MSDWLRRIWGRDHSVGSSKLEPGERMCPGTGEVTTCMDDCHPLGENCNGQASREERAINLKMIADEMDLDDLIKRLTDMIHTGILSVKEAKEILERMLPPRIIAFPGQEEGLELSPALQNLETPTLMNEEVREAVQRLYEKGIPIQAMIQRLSEEGYVADFLLTGRPAEIIEGEVAEDVIVAPAAEDVQRGDAVEIGADGLARRADGGQIVGVAIGGNRMRMLPDLASGVGSIVYGSMAYQASIIGGPGRGFPRAGGPGRFQFNERFPKEVVDKAMKLLEKFMNADQYKAFMEGSLIELQNKAEDHRIMFNRNGKFSILKGPRGAGITMTSGNIGSYKYPLGDEIAVFLDWFNHRTLELIDRWKCGTYTIKDGDLR